MHGIGPAIASTLGADPALSNVVAGPSPAVLRAIADPRIGLALWWRTVPPELRRAAATIVAGDPFERVASGTPADAARAVLRAVPSPRAHSGDLDPLGADIARLAALFSERAGSTLVRIRLEHVTRRTCPVLHVDAVRLRLLCTYSGRGTEWQDACETVRRMPQGHVALFKGTRWAGATGLVRHRSPSLADAPPAGRNRLLVVIDQPALN